MTDLADKFSSLEELLASQHTELMDALNTIAFALGAPPTAPTTNLEDIYNQLTALINGMALIYSADTAFQSSNLALLELINTNTDTIITNNSLNAQRMITALYATFCACETDTPLLTAPLDATPTSLEDEAKCRRIQFYLSVFADWLNKIANYGASGAAITGGTLATLLSVAAVDAGIVATGAEVGAVAGPPGIIVGAVIGLITVAIYTLGGSVLVDYAAQFSAETLQDNLLQALFAAENADEGYTAFKDTILAGMDTIPAEIIYTLWWSAWSNDIYSGSPEVDDSAFDGGICVPEVEECITIDSTMDDVYDFGSFSVSRMAIVWPAPYTASGAQPEGGRYTHSTDVVLTGTLSGYRLRRVSGYTPRVVIWAGTSITDAPTLTAHEVGEYYALPSGTTSIMIDGYGDNTSPFTIEICVPE